MFPCKLQLSKNETNEGRARGIKNDVCDVQHEPSYFMLHDIKIWKKKVVTFTQNYDVKCFQFDQMMKIVEGLGLPPDHLLDIAPNAHHFFIQLSDRSYLPKNSLEGTQVR